MLFTSRLKQRRKPGIEELQKKFDEIAALPNKTWIQVEEMRLLQVQIEEERKRIQSVKDSKRKNPD
jgi:hypothetical protein